MHLDKETTWSKVSCLRKQHNGRDQARTTDLQVERPVRFPLNHLASISPRIISMFSARSLEFVVVPNQSTNQPKKNLFFKSLLHLFIFCLVFFFFSVVVLIIFVLRLYNILVWPNNTANTSKYLIIRLYNIMDNNQLFLRYVVCRCGYFVYVFNWRQKAFH